MAKSARLLVYFLIVFAPIPLGSNRPLLWAINGLIASLAIVLFVLAETSADRRSLLDWRYAIWPAAGLTIWTLWMVIQTIPGMPASVAHPFSSEAGQLVPGVASSISGSRSATFAAIAQAVPVAFLSFVALRIGANAERGLFLLKLVAATTVAVAAYGLAARYIGFRQIFVLSEGVDANYLTGTFAGRSSASSYFLIGLAATTALLASGVAEHLKAGAYRHNRFLAVSDVFESSAIYVVASLVLAAALLNTGSRGGVLAAAVVLPATAWLSLRGSGASRRILYAFVALGLAVCALVAVVAGGTLLHRLSAGVDAGDRPLIFKDTIAMALDRPLLGHGAGSFADIFPLYHEAAPSFGVWLRAHNTFLQWIAELGVPIFIVLTVTVGGVLLFVFRQASGRCSALAVATLAAAAGSAFHSLVDFSVQIQAVGLTLSVLTGAAFGDALAHRRRSTDSRAISSVRPVVRLETVHVTIPSSPKA